MPQLKPTTGLPASGADRVEDAARYLRDEGFVVLSAAVQASLIGASSGTWAWFDRHWDDLTFDTFMRDGGTYRYRRYGRYTLDTGDGALTRRPHTTYRQDSTVNPLNGGIDRKFDPATDAFADDPLVTALVRMLGAIVAAAEDALRWNVELRPFGAITSESETRMPAPQGRHRDGVAYVTTVVINRKNVAGGESSVYTDDGNLRQAVTLGPGDLVLIDDRGCCTMSAPCSPSIRPNRRIGTCCSSTSLFPTPATPRRSRERAEFVRRSLMRKDVPSRRHFVAKIAVLSNDLQADLVNKNEERTRAVAEATSRFTRFLNEMRRRGHHLIHLQRINFSDDPNVGLCNGVAPMQKGTEGAEILPDFLDPVDLVIEKDKDSGFSETELHDPLHALGVETVLVTGEADADLRADHSRRLLPRLQRVVASDCVVSAREENRPRALEWLDGYCATAAYSAEILRSLDARGELPRKVVVTP